MAGKSLPKRCGRAGWKGKYKRYESEHRLDKNKKLKELQNKLDVASQLAKTEATKKLFEEVCAKYQLDSKGKYALKRLIGTINRSRLTCIMNNTIRTQDWFKTRVMTLSVNALKLIQSTQLVVFL